MTIVCAVREPAGGVWIGSDSRVTGSHGFIAPVTLKKWRQVGSLWVGICGHARLLQLVDQLASPPRRPEEWTPVPPTSATDLADLLRSRVREEGWKDESTKDGPSDMGGTAIIVDKESVYELTPGGCLIDYGDEFCAAGSGCEYALGAWHATRDSAPRPLSMTKAIDAALRYDSSCGGQRWIVKVNDGDLFAHDAPAADG